MGDAVTTSTRHVVAVWYPANILACGGVAAAQATPIVGKPTVGNPVATNVFKVAADWFPYQHTHAA